MATRAYKIPHKSLPAREGVRPLRRVSRTKCCLCNADGNVLYTDVYDRHWNVEGQWNLRQCPNAECKLVWLDPCPVPEDIPLMYAEYFTHDGGFQGAAEDLRNQLLPYISSNKTKSRRFSADQIYWGLSRISVFRDFAAGTLMWLQDAPPGEALDFGFGAGQLLIRLRDLGWKVAGVEFDPEVLAMAREEFGIDARASILDFPANKFDVITLSHVIEHVPDPIATLRECASRLKLGGRLVLATPNTNSLGHKRFGANWRPLDPPRHLNLFSPENLTRCAEKAGLEVETARTSARSACFSWYSSKSLIQKKKNAGRSEKAGIGVKASGALFQLWEHYLVKKDEGEEIVLVARRTQEKKLVFL
ncbi:MAG TPA: class I SAM-dependent methyltransferase [Terriglobales bacterium]